MNVALWDRAVTKALPCWRLEGSAEPCSGEDSLRQDNKKAGKRKEKGNYFGRVLNQLISRSGQRAPTARKHFNKEKPTVCLRD